MSNKSCSGSTIIANIHYKHNAFVMMQHARGILTMENVTYSDFMKMMENDNVSRMLTRDTIVHTPNSARSTFHSLVSTPSSCLNNMLESITRQLIQDSTMFDECKNKLLVHNLCMFLMLRFAYKSANSETVIETLTRTTFPLCTRDGGLQIVAVANDFYRNSCCRTRMLLRLPIKHVWHSHNCMTFLVLLTCYSIWFSNLMWRIATSIVL